MKVKGSSKLGKWVSSPKIKTIERIDRNRRNKDACIVFEIAGACVAVFTRKHGEAFVNGTGSMNKARREGVETYAVDADLFNSVNLRYEPSWIIIYITDTDEYWLSQAKLWSDPHTRIARNIGKTRKVLYHLPTQLMKYIPSENNLQLV